MEDLACFHPRDPQQPGTVSVRPTISTAENGARGAMPGHRAQTQRPERSAVPASGRRSMLCGATSLPKRPNEPMELLFDGPARPYGLSPESVLTLIPLAWWAYERFLRRKASTWLLPVVSIALFALINGLRFWDQWRIAHLPPGEVHVTTGAIETSWHIVSRTRDWNQKSLSYRTTTSEGFDVDGLRFRWNVGDSYSPATFSNTQDPPITFSKGTPVEVTWFADSATDGDRRILRLRLGPPPMPSTDGLDTFLVRFAGAVTSGDPAALAAITRFPFAFGAHTMEKDEAATLWAALRQPGLQVCLASAVPVRGADRSARVDCHGTLFEFRTAQDGAWQFVGIPQSR